MQLSGFEVSLENLETCDPIKTNADTGRTVSMDGTPFTEEQMMMPAFPCGLVAKSIFNDTFELIRDSDGDKIPIYQDKIAWDSDIKYKFKNLELKDY